MTISIAGGLTLILAGVIFCYCTEALCFQGMGGGDDLIIEEYGGSKGLDEEVVRFYSQ
jgi:hypothetical protein